jgi:hypothetical protein
VSLDGTDGASPPSHWAALAAPDDPESARRLARARERTPHRRREHRAPVRRGTASARRARRARPRREPRGRRGPRTVGARVALAYVAGDLTIVDRRQGAGLLFIDGALDIQATFDFTGLVVASGGIRIASARAAR